MPGTSTDGSVLTQVPFMDLQRHHRAIAGELRRAFDDVLADGGFVLGAEVERFENEFAEYCGVGHCVGVNSGTAALELSLRAAGIGPGDEVIVPAHTFIASAIAVERAGAAPVFCDVEASTGLLDPDAAAAAIGPRVAAILAVHLYGQVCDVDALGALAARNGLLLLEDAAQAHGARWRGRRAGSLGRAAAFSFYPSKNLGALGDGGAICTDDPELAARARRLRNLGQERKGVHVETGGNERLDGIQAAALRVKLPLLDHWNEARAAVAAAYDRALGGSCELLRTDARGESAHHLYPVRVADRDAVRERLSARGVATGVHYWPAVHRQPPFAASAAALDLPRAERWSERELSLPIFPEMTDAEAAHVAESVHYAIEVTQ